MTGEMSTQRYGGWAEVARLLSTPDRGVSRQQVYIWWTRRFRNGFPDRLRVTDLDLTSQERAQFSMLTEDEITKLSAADATAAQRRRLRLERDRVGEMMLFDLGAVARWYATYVPSHGGRPRKYPERYTQRDEEG